MSIMLSEIRSETGIRMEHLRLAASLLDRVDAGFIKLEAVSVEFLEVCIPSWSQPLSIRIRGLSVDVHQRNMPQARPLRTCLSASTLTLTKGYFPQKQLDLKG